MPTRCPGPASAQHHRYHHRAEAETGSLPIRQHIRYAPTVRRPRETKCVTEPGVHHKSLCDAAFTMHVIMST